VPKPGVASSRPSFGKKKRGKERERERESREREQRERERAEERKQRERKKEGKTKRETRNRSGGDVVATHITAATVPKPDVTSSRPAFEEKRGKEIFV